MIVKNKKGEACISVCVLILVVCMLLSLFITFAEAVNIVRMTQRSTRVVLDNYVMNNAIEIYDSIKNGTDETETISAAVFVSDLSEFCTFEKKGDFYYAMDSSGKEMFRISTPTVGMTNENHLKVYASYTLYIPMMFAGNLSATAAVPITVVSKYTEKF